MIRGGQPSAPTWIGGWQRHFDAVALLVSTRNEAGACRRAGGSIAVEIGKARALLCEAIQHRRADIRCAVAAEIAIADIVGHDENNVGLGVAIKATLPNMVSSNRTIR